MINQGASLKSMGQCFAKHIWETEMFFKIC